MSVDAMRREAQAAQAEKDASDRIRRAVIEFNVAVSAAYELGLRVDAGITSVQGREDADPHLAVSVYREV